MVQKCKFGGFGKKKKIKKIKTCAGEKSYLIKQYFIIILRI